MRTRKMVQNPSRASRETRVSDFYYSSNPFLFGTIKTAFHRGDEDAGGYSAARDSGSDEPEARGFKKVQRLKCGRPAARAGEQWDHSPARRQTGERREVGRAGLRTPFGGLTVTVIRTHS